MLKWSFRNLLGATGCCACTFVCEHVCVVYAYVMTSG